MATQFSAISNNWTDATWQTVNSNSYLNSESANTATTTSYVASQTFTPGAITVEGILLKIKYKTTTATGTFSVQLFNSTGSVAVTAVTCNVTDLPNNDSSAEGGWFYFKFSSPQTLIAATTYSIRVLSSVAGTVFVYRDATGGNWSRGLVTTTTTSLATSDDVIICGNITAAATTTVNTVTFNYTGANVCNTLEIGGYGKLVGENAASTNYVLTIASGGFIKIAQGGIFEGSTSSARLPSSSTFTIILTNATNGVTFIDVRNYGTLRLFGASKTRKCLLSANAAVSATSLTTNISTGWKNGDNIGIAGTTGTTGQFALQQQRTLSADASGTTLTISAGLTNATEGTSPVQADIINLTSNMVIQGSSVSLCGYTLCQKLATYDVDQVEYKFMGATTALTAINIQTNSGPLTSTSSFGIIGYNSIKDCSFWSNTVGTMFNNGNNVGSNYTVDGCVFLSTISNTNTILALGGGVNTVYNSVVRNCVVIGYYIGISVPLSDTVSLDNNVTANCANIALNIGTSAKPLTGCFVSNHKVYRSNYGIYGTPPQATTYVGTNLILSNLTVFRNGAGIYLHCLANSLLKDSTFFGNGISAGGATPNTSLIIGYLWNSKIVNCSFQGGTGTVTSVGVTFSVQDNNYSAAGRLGVSFERCDFGTITQHSICDVKADTAPTLVVFNTCNFGSSTMLGGLALTSNSKISFQRLNGTAGNHRSYTAGGYLINDTVIYDSSPSSLRMVPNTVAFGTNSTNTKLLSTIFNAGVMNGNTVTISIKVRCSVIGDGTAYNGNYPRLILKSNPSAGSSYNLDIICATATAASLGAWEILTYTLPASVTDNVGMEFYVDCDGNAGWVNIDTIT